MKLLSLDCSTTTASLSLIGDAGLVSERVWFEERARHEGLFEAGVSAMAEAGWRWEELSLFTVGRGPGAYSGLRVSLLAAQAWAAPNQFPVVAVSSMEAAALELMEQNNLNDLLVVGDARRKSVWFGHVRRELINHMPTVWHVIAHDQFAAQVPPNTMVATPHPDALAALKLTIEPARWLPETVTPNARAVARLAQMRIKDGMTPEALVPIYMHAAV
jgi:tRNA threonylcarbamoyl adenosine modification protein YeaZ